MMQERNRQIILDWQAFSCKHILAFAGKQMTHWRAGACVTNGKYALSTGKDRSMGNITVGEVGLSFQHSESEDK